MKFPNILLLIFGLLGINAAWQDGGDKLTTAPEEPRKVFYTGKSLQSILIPGEKELQVISTRPPDNEIQPRPENSLIEWKVKSSKVVLVIQVEAKHSELIDPLAWLRRIDPSIDAKLADAARPEPDSWIQSIVKASIVTILKNEADAIFVPGDAISFVEDGGEVEINGVEVKAIVPWAEVFEIGEEYLVFATINPDDRKLLISPAGSYEVVDSSRFRYMLKNAADSISETPADQLYLEIRRIAERSKRK